MPNLLILGASSDIGQAIADEFASNGWSIQLAGRKPEALESKANDIKVRSNVETRTLAFDATDTASHEAFVASLNPMPDLVVCNFGYLGNEDEAKASTEAAEKFIATNFTGAVTVLNGFARRFREQKSGGIIGISSVAGDRGRKSNYHYGSAKAGFTAYLSGLRGDLLESDVHVMTVKPGFVRTAMTEDMDLPDLLTAEPQEVGKAVFQAWEKKRNTLYVKWFWQFIMLIICHVPEFIFKKLNF